MTSLSQYRQSSIGRKQIVATTGLMLILFLCGHLMGNLFIFAGPEAFNKYAAKLAHLRPGLFFIEAGLAFIFLIHMYYTFTLVAENRRARGIKYAVESSKERSLTARLMPLTGFVLLAFVVWHLKDFTFTEHHGQRALLTDGLDYGLYGIVYNSFTDPIHAFLYILAMGAVGLHITHGLQSFLQTFGFMTASNAGSIKKISRTLGVGIAAAFSSIPVYILIHFVTH